jgi:hypothetical protein
MTLFYQLLLTFSNIQYNSKPRSAQYLSQFLNNYSTVQVTLAFSDIVRARDGLSSLSPTDKIRIIGPPQKALHFGVFADGNGTNDGTERYPYQKVKQKKDERYAPRRQKRITGSAQRHRTQRIR